ncbi:DUF6249 domain-containing protein [Microbulbifer hainanensis]|uniref:DUF6249 domain-containing protein n=1 Tax=Microbulbifer hainanensis TaxID=2735675 RepID=UPI001865AEFA|nr:DUF6249 domain-containing protein [Microbulbifer hainanensis]
MNEDTLELLVPFAFFLLIGVSLWMVLHFRARKALEIQETVRFALDKGVELSPELLERLGVDNSQHPQKDFRNGIAWIMTAVGIALFGFFIPDPSHNAFKAMLAIAALPLVAGLSYLVMHRMARHQPA